MTSAARTPPDEPGLLSLLAVTAAGVGLPLALAAGLASGTAGAFWQAPAAQLCALVFVIQWLAYLPAAWWQSEHWYDLTGSLTFILVAGLALRLAPAESLRGDTLALLIMLWAARLGSFLALRVRHAGEDRRFRAIRRSPRRFFIAWTLQGTWVFVTSSAALAAILNPAPPAIDPLYWAGLALWVAGFAIEVVADWQKRQFRGNPANAARFMASGLWALSRHPNYLGEIMLWSGIALMALPALAGPALFTLISPLVVWLLLTRVSGIPILEAQAERQWGEDPDYQRWKAATPVLWPRLGRRR